MSVDTFDFTGAMGGDAAEEAAKSTGGRRGNRADYWSVEDGQSDILRFLTDAYPAESNPVAWITVRQHGFVPTKPKPADWEGNWPSKMGAVCRNDKVFASRYGDCPIDEMLETEGKHKGKKRLAMPRTWALAVRREEVIEDGRVVGIRTKTKEIKVGEKDSEETKIVPDIVIVNMAWKNFFGPMQGFAGRYGTVLDRDYHITRKGSDASTAYQIVPLDVIEMGDGSKYDLRRPDLFQDKFSDLPDLREIVAYQASDEYYNKFFVTGLGSGADGSEKSSEGPANQPSAPSSEPSNDRLAALKSRVQSYGGGGQQAQGESQAQPAGAGGGMRNFD